MMNEEIMYEALERVMIAETLQEAKDEALSALFELDFPDEELITL